MVITSLVHRPSHRPVFDHLNTASDQKLDGGNNQKLCGGKAWGIINNLTVGRPGERSKTGQWEGLGMRIGDCFW